MKVVCSIVFAVNALSLNAQSPVTRDSAGVRIVMNPPFSTARETFIYSTRPIYDVGGLESNPDNEFKSNQGYLRGAFLSDGSLAVTDEARIQFFDPSGKRIRIVGTKGAGPQDFGYLIGICRTRGDTLVTFDSRNRRNAIVTASNGVVRTVPVGDNGSIGFSSCFDDGTVVLDRSDFDRNTNQVTVRYVRARLDGTVVNPIVNPPAAHFDPLTMGSDETATGGKRFYRATSDASEIAAYDATGRLQLIIRYAVTPTKITDADALKRIPYAMPMGGGKPSEADVAAAKAAALARWKSMPHADVWPTHGRLHVDDQGRLWVNQFRMDYDAPDVWIAFAPDGRMIGKLVLPTGRKEVVGFARNGVLVRTADSDGAAHLELHSIVQ